MEFSLMGPTEMLGSLANASVTHCENAAVRTVTEDFCTHMGSQPLSWISAQESRIVPTTRLMCGLTVKLRGRPEALDQAPRAHNVFSARGADVKAVHGPLQR